MTIRSALVILWTMFLAVNAGPARADSVFGLYGGAGAWQQDTGGKVAAGITNIDVERDLALEDELNNVFYLAVEHPLPGVPNVRMQYTDIAANGSSVLDRMIEFNGVVFDIADALATEVALTQMDAVLYYEVLDNVVSLDVGMGARYLDGDVALMSDSGASRARFKDALPMLYGRARADLPFSGFWLGAEVMGLGIDHNEMLDANAQLGWESALGFGAELGWRTYRLNFVDIGDVDRAGIDMSGPYFAVSFHL